MSAQHLVHLRVFCLGGSLSRSKTSRKDPAPGPLQDEVRLEILVVFRDGAVLSMPSSVECRTHKVSETMDVAL
jgi:hypothetical protein